MAGPGARLPVRVGGGTTKPSIAFPTYTSHRGWGGSWNGWSEGPLGGLEESMLSIRAAIAAGQSAGAVPAINIHVQGLSDGTLVCIHDATVSRTTNGAGNVTDYDAAAWSLLSLTPAAQAGYGIAPVTIQQPPTLLQVLTEFGGKAHFMIEATAPVTAQIVALVKALGLENSVTINAFSAARCSIAAAAGIPTIYNSPNLGLAGSDAPTIAAQNCWPTGAAKTVGINYQPSSTLSVTTTSGSTAVTAASGLLPFNGWNIRGTGVPFGATMTVVDDTHATLSAPATAAGTVVMSLWPTRALMVAYIGTLVAAGLTILAYIVNLRSDRDWLLAAGVTYFGGDEFLYLQSTAQLRGSNADPTSKGAWPSGVLLADPVLPNQSSWGRGSILNGGHTLDRVVGNSEMWLIRGDVSFLGAIPATYTVRADFAFVTMPSDTTRWLGVRFAAPTDANHSDSATFGAGIKDGYSALVGGNGQLRLFRALGGVVTQLGATQTMSTLPTAGVTFRLKIAVTATQITVSVVDSANEATVYATVTVTDNALRGGFIGLGKSETVASPHIPVFKNLTAA